MENLFLVSNCAVTFSAFCISKAQKACAPINRGYYCTKKTTTLECTVERFLFIFPNFYWVHHLAFSFVDICAHLLPIPMDLSKRENMSPLG